MPTLDWIGKKAVLNHHREVPFHLLKCDESFSVGKADSGNLLVQGDNLIALKSLLPYYAGKVKCIYIDPPYNSGEQTWTYNDHVSSPEISKWLGKTVGREVDDLTRHDKWLCMMYPRMQLLTEFLADDGLLFVSLDDTELYRFKLMMEEILSPDRFVATLIWKSRRNLDSRHKQNISTDHEYVIAFRGRDGRFRGAFKDQTKYSNPDNDTRGPWMSDNLVGLATKDRRPNLHYDLIDPATGINYGCPAKGWRYSKETMAQKIAESRIIWPRSPQGRPRHKKFQSDLESDFTGFSSLVECGNTNEGTEELAEIMDGPQFIFPKPRTLIESLIQQATGPEDSVLDSFAGSGTTGHAVLNVNKQDGGSRKFILVEMDENICQNITAQRLRKVVEGYTVDKNGKKTKISGLGGGFRFCRLGEPLFDEVGNIRASVSFSDLAAHIYFTETGSPLPKRAKADSPLLGVHEERAIYLLYNGILGDKKPDGGNVLTGDVLQSLPTHAGPKVIYGEACRLGGSRLQAGQITFKQIPYQIKVN